VSEESTRFGDAERQIEQMEAVLEQTRRGLEAADRAERAAREAAEHARESVRRVTIAAAVILVAVVLGRLTLRHHRG